MSRNPVRGRKTKAERTFTCVLCGQPIRKSSAICELYFPLRGVYDPLRPWGKRAHWKCYLTFLREFPCAYCGAWREGRMQVDHVRPTSRGGLDLPDNLAPCCSDCNSSKGQNTPEEWMGPA